HEAVAVSQGRHRCARLQQRQRAGAERRPANPDRRDRSRPQDTHRPGHRQRRAITAMADARRYFELSSPFRMKRGGSLTGARVAYETWGRLSARRDNAILILTGLSPSAHAAANEEDPLPRWREEMHGPGKPIDSDRRCDLCGETLVSGTVSTCTS